MVTYQWGLKLHIISFPALFSRFQVIISLQKKSWIKFSGNSQKYIIKVGKDNGEIAKYIVEKQDNERSEYTSNEDGIDYGDYPMEEAKIIERVLLEPLLNNQDTDFKYHDYDEDYKDEVKR